MNKTTDHSFGRSASSRTGQSAFGLLLHDRNPLLRGATFVDSHNTRMATLRRMENYCAYLYPGSTDRVGDYWKAYAMKTVAEIAQYRGLFGYDGFLKSE